MRQRKVCHVTYDGYTFIQLEDETNVDHHIGDITDYLGRPLFAAGFFDDDGTTEIRNCYEPRLKCAFGCSKTGIRGI